MHLQLYAFFIYHKGGVLNEINLTPTFRHRGVRESVRKSEKLGFVRSKKDESD